MWLKRIWRTSWKLAIAAAIVALVVYRLHFAPAAVQSHVVAAGPITAEVMGTGTLEARVQATISSKISGRIAQVLADQGDRVTQGQLLTTLDDGELHQQVEMARAELAIAQAGVERAEAEITRAKATARLAQFERDRTTQMRQEAAATEHELSVANERYNIAEADLERAQLACVEMERQVIKAEKSLRYYQERLADTRIVSPFDGLVVLRNREPGDIVVPGGTILQMVRTDPMWVSVWVDESVMSDLAVGQLARVVFRSEPNQPYRGEVARLASQTDRETREFVVDVKVDELPRTWAVGQRAEVYIHTAHKEKVLLVPQSAIVWLNGRCSVFVAEAGRARRREVQLGLRGATMVEVVEGLADGERIVWPAAADGSLTDGKAVESP